MLDAFVHFRLALQEQFHMALLQDEGQTESLNGKRNLLRIVVESQQVKLADDGLDAALEFTHACLAARVILNHKLENVLADAYLFVQSRLLECTRKQIVLGNLQLLLDTEALDCNVKHTVAQNWVDLLVIVL